MEKSVSSEEIRKAVWDCGNDKAPGPDGFTFLFLKRYWDILKGDAVYTFPGEGKGYVKEILSDLKANGYNKGISIEPHIAVVFHDENVKASEEKQYRSYVEYGQKLNQIIKELK